jgi:hypothetical protein
LIVPGSAAGLLVFENTWVGPFVAAMREAEGEALAAGRIPGDDVIAILDVLDSSSA